MTLGFHNCSVRCSVMKFIVRALILRAFISVSTEKLMKGLEIIESKALKTSVIFHIIEGKIKETTLKQTTHIHYKQNPLILSTVSNSTW